MPDFHVHWVPVLVGTASWFVLGAIWYGVFSAAWLRGIGSTKAEVQAEGVPWIYGVQLVATFLAVLLATYVLHDGLGVDDWTSGACGGLLLGALASLASSGDFLYERRRRNVPLVLVNSGYRIAGLVIVGILVGVL